MRVLVELEVEPREGESPASLVDRVDALLCHGTVRDSFDSAGIECSAIQVVSLREAIERGGYER